MKLQPIFDLQTEVNRLFIAGSKFSKDDPRLAKHVPVFQKMGEKVPVFNKIATDIEALLKAPSNESATQLMELSNILYAVLYTQGETMPEEGEKTPQKPIIALKDANTKSSYLALKPVIEALSKANSGRLEIIQDAYKQGVFKDIRTFYYLNGALGDKYSELADYVAETVIPSIGSVIEPFIRTRFELDDKSENVRRFKCMIALKSTNLDESIKLIFEQNLPNLQATAIEYLKTDKNNEEFITQLTEDKNKIVRKAAYDALRSMKTPSAFKKLINIFEKTFKKGNNDLYEAISLIEDTSQIDVLLKYLSEEVKTIKNLEDEKEIGKATEKFYNALSVLEYKYTSIASDFVFEIISDNKLVEKISKGKSSWYNSIDSIVRRTFMVINSWGLENSIPFYEKLLPLKRNKAWDEWFYSTYKSAGFSHYSGEQFYTIFGPLYNEGKTNFDQITEYSSNQETFFRYKLREDKALDIRWKKLIENKLKSIKKFSYDNQRDVFVLGIIVGQDDKEYVKMLLNLFQTVDIDISMEFMGPLLKLRTPNIHEIIYDRIKNLDWKKNSYYRLTYDESWKLFPKEYVEKFEKLSKESNTGQIGLIAERIKEVYN